MILNNPQELGSAIRAERLRHGVLQKDLAMAAGTGLRFIVDLEKGKPTCHLGKTFQVMQALGMRLSLQSQTEPDQGKR